MPARQLIVPAFLLLAGTPGIASEFADVRDLVGSAERLVVLRESPPELLEVAADGSVRTRVDLADALDLPAALVEPIALCWDRADTSDHPAGVYVLTHQGRRVWQFDPGLQVQGRASLIHDPDMRGVDLDVGLDGAIIVADADLPGLRVFDARGQQRLAFGTRATFDSYTPPTADRSGQFAQPASIAVTPAGLVYVGDEANHTYLVYRYDAEANRLAWITHGPWVPDPAGLALDPAGLLLMTGRFEYYSRFGALRVMTTEGLGRRVFLGHALGDMPRTARACVGPGGQYYLADPAGGRILILPPEFSESLPAFCWTDDGGVELKLKHVDGHDLVFTSTRRTADGQRILVAPADSTCKSWPPFPPDALRPYALPPPPPAGQRYVIDMPVLVAVFTKVRDAEGNAHVVAPEGVADRLARELVPERLFYWRVSHGTLNKQYELMIIDDDEPTLDGPWIPPDEGRRRVNAARARRNLPPIDDHHSLVVIYARAGFDPAATDSPGCVGGGGLTDFAYSCYALWNHGQGWLMGHEWGHQLDGYFERSGFPDWWLNHPDGTVHLGRFGEHWDCNAFLCRRADAMNWLRLQFGTLRLVADQDGDGLADQDATLPLDEVRFGSDPARADTDLDGLDDLREATAGSFSSTDPAHADTDRDGSFDAQDPYPCFAVTSLLKAGAPDANGRLMAKFHRRIGPIERDWCYVDVMGAHDADHVYLMYVLQSRVREVHATIDFNDDGWFTGRDNVHAFAHVEWPADREAFISSRGGAEVGLHHTRFGSVVRLKVRRPDARPPMKSGETIGVAFRVENGRGQVAFLLDPWQVLRLELE